MTVRDVAIRFRHRVTGEKHGHGHACMSAECVNAIYTKMATKFVILILDLHKNILLFSGGLRPVVERAKPA